MSFDFSKIAFIGGTSIVGMVVGALFTGDFEPAVDLGENIADILEDKLEHITDYPDDASKLSELLENIEAVEKEHGVDYAEEYAEKISNQISGKGIEIPEDATREEVINLYPKQLDTLPNAIREHLSEADIKAYDYYNANVSEDRLPYINAEFNAKDAVDQIPSSIKTTALVSGAGLGASVGTTLVLAQGAEKTIEGRVGSALSEHSKG